MTIDLDEYRRHRGEKSRLMCRQLNWAFNKLGVPGATRHALMGMDQETFLAWVREEKIISLEKIELAIKFTQLYRALHAVHGDNELAMHRWLFSENDEHPDLFKGRSPVEAILEDGERIIRDVTATLRKQ